VLALFFGILAAAGVFSGGKAKPTPVTTQQTPTTTQTTTTPTTTASTPAIVVPTSTLKPGDTGAQVTELQKALAHVGYSPGAIDGNYGSGTTDAVKRFQQAHGLTADGVAGPQTLAALETAVQSG
jgi:peptidoglycan hydrolase-like protein with peptidoglycan-binding domain